MSALAAELAPFLALGALGSLHCAGMCGGFAVAVTAVGRGGTAATLQRQAGYVLGKACTYAVVGLVLARGFSELAHTRAAGAAAWLAGGALILIGLGWLRLLPRRGPSRLVRAPGVERALAAARRANADLIRIPGFAGAFGAGAVNGLVPCGLSWAAFALAAGASPAAAILGPFLFGLATAPSLAVVGAGAWLLRRAPLRRAAPAVIGLALIGGGVLTGLRGVPTADGEPSCCAGESSTSSNSAEPVRETDQRSP